MLRTLRAFAWLRWRILLNALDRQPGRDVLQRFSMASEQIGPAIVLLLLVPSGLSVAAVALAAGWGLAHGNGSPATLKIVGFVLLSATAFAAAAPIVLPGGGRTSPVRLLLLPIPRPVLFLTQTLSSLADPWILLAAAAVLPLPLGLAAGGALHAAASTAVAALLVLAVLTGLTALATAIVQFVLHDRRRGEIAALCLVLLLPLTAAIPELLGRGIQDRSMARRDPPARPEGVSPWRSAAGSAARAVAPSENFIRTARSATDGTPGVPAVPLATLAAMALAVHGLSYRLFTRLLGSPFGSTARRGGAVRWTSWRVPGVRPATSAVALNHVRLAIRTPRGRSTILSPLIVFAVFAILLPRQVPGLGSLGVTGGVGLAAFSCAICLLAIVPLAMNQFAVDGAGLTLMYLSPLATESLLLGKALGNGVVAAAPAAACFAAALALYPGGSAWTWVCVPAVALSTYLLASPGAAIVSAMFPRKVDLNSIGQGSNAHPAAGLLAFFVFALASAPAWLLILAARALLEPASAALLLILWTAAAAAIAAVLLKAAARFVERRRESVAMVV